MLMFSNLSHDIEPCDNQLVTKNILVSLDKPNIFGILTTLHTTWPVISLGG
jgi:hypothetical protein